MCNIYYRITAEETGKDGLDNRVFTIGDAHGVGNVLHNIWYTDFRKQQIKSSLWQIKLTITSGHYNGIHDSFVIHVVGQWKRSNKWSTNTIRISILVIYVYHFIIALAVFIQGTDFEEF